MIDSIRCTSSALMRGSAAHRLRFGHTASAGGTAEWRIAAAITRAHMRTDTHITYAHAHTHARTGAACHCADLTGRWRGRAVGEPREGQRLVRGRLGEALCCGTSSTQQRRPPATARSSTGMSIPPTVRLLRPQVQATDLGALLRFAYVPISPAFVRGKPMHADVRCSEL
jgi:hypothetical protein